MGKPKQIYICQSCGYESYKWLGKCPECDSWNTFVEEIIEKPSTGGSRRPPQREPVRLSQVELSTAPKRIHTGMAELDRVLGGGIFPASVVLLAGEPGIGKSTLMLQMLLQLASQKENVLYISGEESLEQIKSRASRIAPSADALLVLAETNLEDILYHLEKLKPVVVVVDSIQSIYSSQLSGSPGNVSQVRECAAQLFQSAKRQGFSLFLVGHVTKEGAIAGPKVLEHLVDAVIYFENTSQQYRIIRATKNRFGATNEIGVFEMRNQGLVEVGDISGLFLSPAHRPPVGSSLVCSYEGSRPLMVEVQALVSRSHYGTPQRTVSGLDYRRLALILAVLERYVGLDFGIYDVFVKIAGGFRIDDPALDLAVAAALYSSRLDQPLEKDRVYLGELGLGGEVRPVAYLESRLQEIQKMGFRQVVLSAHQSLDASLKRNLTLQMLPVERVIDVFPPKKKMS
ncbi:MAG: DNA repair protein RadA [Calditrichaeota bacterium]|nr:DNA repair protein RadA [Calditrichota bacterium]